MSSENAVVLGHLDFLDGLRGVAANWVLLAHIMIWGGWYGLPLPDAKIAVDLFVVLSGFLMLHVSESRIPREDVDFAFSLRFFCRRLLRIAPLYYVALLTAWLISAQVEDGYRALQSVNPRWWKNSFYDNLSLDLSWESVLLHITFLYGFFPRFASCSGLPDWSIALEMQFYVCFPLLLWLFRSIGPVSSTLVVTWVARQLLSLIDTKAFPEPCFLPLKIDVFLVGMLLNCCVRHSGSRSSTVPLAWLLSISIALSHSTLLAALCVVVAVCALDFRAAEPIIRYSGCLIKRGLASRIFRFLGDTSYAVYLFHGFFISIVGGWIVRDEDLSGLRPVFRTAILGVLAILLTYAVAWPLHRCVELPFIRLGRRLLVVRSQGGCLDRKEAI